MRHYSRRIGAVFGLCALASSTFAVSGCQAGSGEGGGISAEDYQSLTGPAPSGVTAETRDGAVLVRWRPPAMPESTANLAFDPKVLAYRVFRVMPNGRRVLVGETGGLSITDRSAPAGRTLRYVVTAVRPADRLSESGPSAPVRLP